MLRTHGEVQYLDFEIYNKYPELTAVFSTKKGGVSEGIYESMNLSFTNNDNPENIRKNYKIISDAIGIDIKDIVLSDQKHTTNIKIAKKEDAGKGIVKVKDYEAVDGFITDEKNVFLSLIYADCVPVYLFDYQKKVIALLHSGWKGTVGKISAKAVNMMEKVYSSNPENILCVIGPAICKECYEVSEDLFINFEKEFNESEMKEIFSDAYKNSEGEDKYLLDLKKAINLTLQSTGILKENIHDPQICTCCEHELYFSHRYTDGKRGNMAAIMGIKS